MTEFTFERNFTYDGDIEKFITYRVNYGQNKKDELYGKIKCYEMEGEHEKDGIKKFTKVITKEITLPAIIKAVDALNLTCFDINETITIHPDGKFHSTMSAPQSFNSFFNYTEHYNCSSEIINGKEKLVASFKVKGVHNTPKFLHKTIEDMYFKQRIARIKEEFILSQDDSYFEDEDSDDDIIQ